MHKRSKVALTALAFAIAAGLGYGAGQAQARQPGMYDALRHLREARGDLERAGHDKGGHRELAMGHVDQAILEVQAGMAYADHM